LLFLSLRDRVGRTSRCSGSIMQKSGGSRQQRGLGLSCQGPWPTTSQRIFMSAAKKTGNQVIARWSVKLARASAFLPVVRRTRSKVPGIGPQTPEGSLKRRIKPRSYGLDAAGGSVTFSVVFLWCPPNPRPYYVQRGL
jgi:hypothetical protein